MVVAKPFTNQGAVFLILSCCLFLNRQPPAPHSFLRVVYGQDYRLDPKDFASNSNPYVWSQSVALMVDESALLEEEAHHYSFAFYQTFADSMQASNRPLCLNEPFRDQPIVEGLCSAFLIAPDIMVTAGHCVTTALCPYVHLIFGFGDDGTHTDLHQIKSENLYACKQSLKTRKNNGRCGLCNHSNRSSC